MLTTESAIVIVNDFISKIQAEGIEIQKAVLYGSFAVNSQNEWSDIDLALVSDSFTGFGFEDKCSFAKINSQKPYSLIHAKTFHTIYFDKGDPFVDQIKKMGIILKPATSVR
jgi:predicted nucleotidyltransferase